MADYQFNMMPNNLAILSRISNIEPTRIENGICSFTVQSDPEIVDIYRRFADALYNANVVSGEHLVGVYDIGGGLSEFQITEDQLESLKEYSGLTRTIQKNKQESESKNLPSASVGSTKLK